MISRFIGNYNARRRLLRERGALYYLKGSSGYVLIIVLVITTLLIAVAGEFIVVAQINIGYGQKLKNRLKAGYLAKSGVQLGQFVLYADLKGANAEMLTGKPTQKDVDSYNDIWAIDYPAIPIDDGTLKVSIIDENSKINLSAMANEYTGDDNTKFYYFVQNFFMNMGLLPDFADIIRDWVDVDDTRMPYGAEGPDYYQRQPSPYPSKNNAMDSIDELLLLRDMSPEIYYGMGGGGTDSEKSEQGLVDHNKGAISLDWDKIQEMIGGAGNAEKPDRDENKELTAIGKEKSRELRDYFTVYGDRQDWTSEMNKININTASYRVISALTDKMTPDIVTEIIHRRIVQPFKSVDEIKDLISDQTVLDRLTVRSYIFRIVSTASVGDTKVMITAVYNRNLRNMYYWSEE